MLIRPEVVETNVHQKFDTYFVLRTNSFEDHEWTTYSINGEKESHYGK